MFDSLNHIGQFRVLLQILLLGKDLQQDDDSADRQTDDVRIGLGDTGADTAHHQQQPLPHGDIGQQVAGHGKDQHRGAQSQNPGVVEDLQKRTVHQNAGLIYKGKGGKKGHGSIDHATPAGIPRLCVRNAGGGVGGDADGRGDLGENAEIENEHVGSQRADAQTLQGGDEQDVSRQVGGHGGQCHAQQHAAQHGDDQTDPHQVAAHGRDDRTEAGGQAGDGDNTDDNAAAGDGLGGIGGQAGGIQHLLDDMDGAIAHLGTDDVQHQNSGDAVQGGALQSAAHGNGNHQHHNGTQQIQPGQDGLALQIHLHAFTSVGSLFCQHVNQQEDRQIVHDRGDDGGLADGHVGDAQHLGHQEGASAHDRRHDLTAGRGRSLDCAGLLGSIAHLLHHGDGHDAGASYVGSSRAGDHTHQAGGHNSGLGRAGVVVGLGTKLDADVDQNLAASAGAKQRTEYHDPVHEARACAGGGTVNALATHDHQVSELLDIHAAVVENTGQPSGSPDICDKHADKDHQGQAHGSINAQQNQEDQGDALKDINGVDGIQIVDAETQPFKLAEGIPNMIEECDEYEPVRDDVKRTAGLALVLARVQQHAEETDAGHMDGTN